MFRSQIGAFALVAALVLPLAASAQAVPSAGAPAPQNPPSAVRHHHHHGGAYMRALHSLELSAAQKMQIRTMMQQAKASATGGAPVDKATRRANSVALRQQIDGVLTDMQRAELHAKLRAQRQSMKPAAPAPAAPTQ